MSQRRQRFFLSVIRILCNHPFIIAFLCYIPSIVLPSDNPWIYDDHAAITTNQCIRGEDASGAQIPWKCLLTVDYWGTPMQDKHSHKSYRPVTSLLFRVENVLWGTSDARPWHFVNAVLHAFCTQLVLQLARSLMPTEPVGVHQIVAIIFAVHPIHTDCVSNATGCCEVLSAIFMLLAYFTVQRFRTAIALPTSLLLVVLATLSKEQGFTVVGIILAYFVCCEIQHLKLSNAFMFSNHSRFETLKNFRMSTLVKLALWAVGGASLFWCRLKVQVETPPYSLWQNPAAFHASGLVRFLSRIYLLYYHAFLLVWPMILCPDYSNGAVPVVESFLDQRLLMAYVWLASVFIGTIAAVRYSLRSEINATPLIMSVTWLIFPFIPASSIFFPVGFTVAERVLYSPSIGFCLLFGLLCGAFIRWSRKHPEALSWGRWSLCFILVTFGVRTLLRDLDWKSSSAMWESSVKACAPNAVNYGNRATDVMKSDQHARAEVLMKKAVVVALPISNHFMELKLSSLYIKTGRFQEARQICNRFRNPSSVFCQGQIDEKEKKWESAISQYEWILNKTFSPAEYKRERLDYWSVVMNHLFCTLEHDKLRRNGTRTINLAYSILNDTRWKIRHNEESYAHEKLAEAYGLHEKWKNMEERLLRSVVSSPDNVHYFRRALQICFELGRLEIGLRFLQKYRDKFDPQDDEVVKWVDKYQKLQYLKKRDAAQFVENEKRLEEILKPLESTNNSTAKILKIFEVIGNYSDRNISVHSVLFLRRYLEEMRETILHPDIKGDLKRIFMDLSSGEDHHIVGSLSKMLNDGRSSVLSIVRDVKRDLEIIDRKKKSKEKDGERQIEKVSDSTK